MKQKCSLVPKILISLCLSLIFSNLSFSEPQNLSLLKKEIQTYYDSGLYQRELERKISCAKEYIVKRAQANQKSKNPRKLALVLDIDETSLSNYSKMVKRDFIGDRAQIHKEILAADSPAIKPMLELYNEALKNHIKVFFVTGRQKSEYDATRLNLLNAGYAKWSGLYVRPDEYSHPSIINFKSSTRAQIAQKGYTIIASIGDQESDLSGGYAEKGFKLPNPFYYLP